MTERAATNDPTTCHMCKRELVTQQGMVLAWWPDEPTAKTPLCMGLLAEVDKGNIPGWTASAGGLEVIEIRLPLRLRSEANERDSWQAKSARAKEQRAIVRMRLTPEVRRVVMVTPYLVTITRIGPRVLDGDNLQRSAKAVRDTIAECLGLDDGDQRITWVYAQEKSTRFTRGRLPVNAFAIKIRVEHVESANQDCESRL